MAYRGILRNGGLFLPTLDGEVEVKPIKKVSEWRAPSQGFTGAKFPRWETWIAERVDGGRIKVKVRVEDETQSLYLGLILADDDPPVSPVGGIPVPALDSFLSPEEFGEVIRSAHQAGQDR